MINRNLPIAMLHHVNDKPHPSLKSWTISHHKFTELLDLINENGLTTTTFEEIVNRNFKKNDLRKKIILTFDDCPAALFDFAVPELIKRKMKAVFFIPSAHIGGYNLWDAEVREFTKIPLINEVQIKDLVKHGMEIGSHGTHHVRLNACCLKTLHHEIYHSKDELEYILGKKIYSFAYPYAEVPKNYKNLLSNAGYAFGICLYKPFRNNFALRRFGVHESDNKKSLKFKISPKYAIFRALIDPLLYLVKKIKV